MWLKINNRHYSDIIFSEDNLQLLPEDDIHAGISTIVDTDGTDGTDQKKKRQGKEKISGGSDLSHSFEDSKEFLSTVDFRTTITVGDVLEQHSVNDITISKILSSFATEKHNENIKNKQCHDHRQASSTQQSLSQSNTHLSFISEMHRMAVDCSTNPSYFNSNQKTQTTEDGVRLFIDGKDIPGPGDIKLVRGGDFAKEATGKWLETSFPALFPYGRGCNENLLREANNLKKKIYPICCVSLRANMLKYMTRDTFILAKRAVPTNPANTWAEEYGQLDVPDFKKGAEMFERKFIERTRNRPYNMNMQHESESISNSDDNAGSNSNSSASVASKFFESMLAATSSSPTSAKAAKIACRRLFSMMYSLGSPTLWVTVSIDDICNPNVWKILCHDIHTGIPVKEIRLKVNSDYSGAAVLNFERVERIFVDYILGWDRKLNRPKKGDHFQRKDSASFDQPDYLGGEQARKSLHFHSLIWLVGYDNLVENVRSKLAIKVLERNIDAFVSCESPLPEQEKKVALHCLDKKCNGKLAVESKDKVEVRKQQKKGSATKDTLILVCANCSTKYGSTTMLNHALSAGFKRLGLENYYQKHTSNFDLPQHIRGYI
eukprot:g42490.t1